MENSKRAARNQKEDAVLNKVLIWFGAAVVVELVMLLINRYYINYTTLEIELMYTLSKVFPVLAGVGLVGAAASVFWYLSAQRKGGKAALPLVLAWVSATACVCFGVTYWFRAAGVQLLCGAVPVVAVMALVFYLYQKEFFAVTALCAVGILGLWIVRRADGGSTALVYGYAVFTAVVALTAALLFYALQKKNGTLARGEKHVQVFPHGANYGMLYLTCGLVAAAVIAACVMGTAVAYYLIFGLVAWLFVMAVYYTVKLM